MPRMKTSLTKEQLEISKKAMEEAVIFFSSDSNNVSRRHLAEALNVSTQTIGKFCKGIRYVPYERAIMIHELTGGRIDKTRLRPDKF